MRLLAGLLALSALAVHIGFTSRFRAQAGAAADDFRRLRDERRQLTQRLDQRSRLHEAQRRAGRLAAEGGGQASVRAARISVVESLRDSGVEHVRLGVQPVTRGPLVATLRLTAEGAFDDVVRFAGHVVRPGTGLVLSRASLHTQPPGVVLSLEAVGLGSVP
jgi:hypothetical protein